MKNWWVKEDSAQPCNDRQSESLFVFYKAYILHGQCMMLTIHVYLVPRSVMIKSHTFSPPWHVNSGSGTALQLLYFIYRISVQPKIEICNHLIKGSLNLE
jgi:hypothetical protein